MLFRVEINKRSSREASLSGETRGNFSERLNKFNVWMPVKSVIKPRDMMSIDVAEHKEVCVERKGLSILSEILSSKQQSLEEGER